MRSLARVILVDGCLNNHVLSAIAVPAIDLLGVQLAVPVITEEQSASGGDDFLIAYTGLNPVVAPAGCTAWPAGTLFAPVDAAALQAVAANALPKPIASGTWSGPSGFWGSLGADYSLHGAAGPTASRATTYPTITTMMTGPAATARAASSHPAALTALRGSRLQVTDLGGTSRLSGRLRGEGERRQVPDHHRGAVGRKGVRGHGRHQPGDRGSQVDDLRVPCRPLQRADDPCGAGQRLGRQLDLDGPHLPGVRAGGDAGPVDLRSGQMPGAGSGADGADVPPGVPPGVALVLGR